MSFLSINPKNENLIFELNEFSQNDTNEIINKAYFSHQKWKTVEIEERATFLSRTADILKNKKEFYAKLISDEMGKPVSQSAAEVLKCATVCEYYAQNAQNFLKAEIIESGKLKASISFQPLGIILGIMPWNFPFWQVFRFAVPAIMAGNAALLKHAPNVSMCALEIEKIFYEAGFPEDLFRTLIVSVDKVPGIIENSFIQGISITGGTIAGKKVAAKAGDCLKKTVLELGGSDPYIIMQDADLESASESCVAGRLLNAGQSCIAAKRFIVHQDIYKNFLEMFTEKMKQKTYGDPLENYDLGPLARKDLRDNIHELVSGSVLKGAKLLTGGKIPDMKGYFYPPTVLAEVTTDMPVWREETFGPAAAVIKYSTDDEAVKLANDTEYGLGAAIFSRNIEKAQKIAENQINAGSCVINDFVKSDPRLPFGGIKESGYGRELSLFGIREFVNIKTIVFN